MAAGWSAIEGGSCASAGCATPEVAATAIANSVRRIRRVPRMASSPTGSNATRSAPNPAQWPGSRRCPGRRSRLASRGGAPSPRPATRPGSSDGFGPAVATAVFRLRNGRPLENVTGSDAVGSATRCVAAGNGGAGAAGFALAPAGGRRGPARGTADPRTAWCRRQTAGSAWGATLGSHRPAVRSQVETRRAAGPSPGVLKSLGETNRVAKFVASGSRPSNAPDQASRRP